MMRNRLYLFLPLIFFLLLFHSCWSFKSERTLEANYMISNELLDTILLCSGNLIGYAFVLYGDTAFAYADKVVTMPPQSLVLLLDTSSISDEKIYTNDYPSIRKSYGTKTDDFEHFSAFNTFVPSDLRIYKKGIADQLKLNVQDTAQWTVVYRGFDSYGAEVITRVHKYTYLYVIE